MKVIGYFRFSPRRDASTCTSIEVQREDFRKWAAENKHQIVAECGDYALSGGDSWEEREGLLDVMKTAKRGMAIVVRSLDRLFRDTQKALFFIAEMRSKGVKVVSVSEPEACRDTPESKLLQTIFFGVAEYQRELIRARTKAKMRQHQMNGRAMSFIPPYGYFRDGKDLVEDPDEQNAILRVKELYVAGKRSRATARQMNREGFPARGQEWTPTAVARIVDRLKRAGWIRETKPGDALPSLPAPAPETQASADDPA